MQESKNKIIKLMLWAVAMLLVIAISMIITTLQKSKSQEENVIVYDGSEDNPYIEGVQ
ncbi:hypothetical protein acsn021_11400 [Anaerocolumna cellulosilytica]|uniref:Uncharacterized protein n=1 Tax=Anaerocolumna cellulosilytica TaxID=433286 RepID=A0A6S6R344_9FIRM|nr:hypothetical protein [Anaerocolumna cellulosilytica]MBB5194626.1 ABC-type Na+ efflux pump permease subunit [Anaerocolumna cellulosilytica]BCJ93571.1 hypothetical protein acsn021_11400 [Anaerocolumna cellulosilytica]